MRKCLNSYRRNSRRNCRYMCCGNRHNSLHRMKSGIQYSIRQSIRLNTH